MNDEVLITTDCPSTSTRLVIPTTSGQSGAFLLIVFEGTNLFQVIGNKRHVNAADTDLKRAQEEVY